MLEEQRTKEALLRSAFIKIKPGFTDLWCNFFILTYTENNMLRG